MDYLYWRTNLLYNLSSQLQSWWIWYYAVDLFDNYSLSELSLLQYAQMNAGQFTLIMKIIPISVICSPNSVLQFIFPWHEIHHSVQTKLF
jgi:hypothetical protein